MTDPIAVLRADVDAVADAVAAADAQLAADTQLITDLQAQLAAAQAQAAAEQGPRPMTRPTGTVTVAGVTVPYVPIETLGFGPGDDPNKIVAAMTGPGVLTFPPGIFPITGFGKGYVTGFDIPHGASQGTNGKCFGVVGSGPGSLDRDAPGTYFALTPGSSRLTDPALIQNAYVMKAADPLALLFGQFRVCGSEQGHQFSGFALYHPRAASRVFDVCVDGWSGSGNQGVANGETNGFTVIDLGDGVRRDHLIERLEADGRRAGGLMYGTAPLGGQGMNGGYFIDCYGHDCLASQVGWFKSRNITTVRLRAARNGTGTGSKSGQGINHEQTTGVVHLSPALDVPRANGNTGTHISHSNYGGTSPYAPGALTIADAGTLVDGQPAGLVAQSWSPYSAANTAAPVVTAAGKPAAYTWQHA